MATSKRKPAAKKPTARKRTTKKSDIDRRWSILLFALGVLFIVLSFVPGSSLWLTLRENVLFGAFGISGWLIGPFLLYTALLVSFEKPIFGPVIRCALFVLAFSGAALIFSKVEIADKGFGDIMAALLENGRVSTFGGGLVSLFFGVPLLLFGRPAANVLVVLVMIVAAMVLTGVTPAEIYRFIRNLLGLIPKREYEEQEDDLFVEKEPPAPKRREPPPPAPKKARRRKAVDIDLGPDEPVSTPGGAAHDEVEIGPGGTFGLNPLGEKQPAVALHDEPILPFDPHSQQSLFDEEAVQNAAPLFGEDDPLAEAAQSGELFAGAPIAEEFQYGAAQPASLFDEPAPTSSLRQSVPEDLFGRPEPAAAPVQFPKAGGEAARQPEPEAAAPAQFPGLETPAPTGVTMAGEVAGEGATADPDVQAMIDKAAAKKPGEDVAAPDTRPGPDTFEPYQYPPASLFEAPASANDAGARDEMKKTAELLVNTLASFGVQTRILDVSRGPSVTRYEVQPQTGVKISRITNLADDIALNLAAAGVRIEAPIPGKPAVGIEVPNRLKSPVSIRSILESAAFSQSDSPLTIALGKDIAGEPVVADLTKMPHLLVAGSTGSGKSVCINSIIMSLLYKSSPEDLRLVLVDPKVVELAEYNGIPHLLMPVVTEPRKAAGALGMMVAEMDKRYRTFAEENVRDIKTYNKKAARNGHLEKMHYIAIVIDELADLMMTSGKEVEDYICRLAQKARAAGMHLIVATQRPSVDVITGLIKANIPSRIAFAVSSQVDSRTILDGAGAEKLLGMGDMLFMPVGANKPLRVQGTYVKDKEIHGVLRFVKESSGGARYDEDLIKQVETSAAQGDGGGNGGDDGEDMINDPTLREAVEVALDQGQISTSFLQRRLRLGYARAGRIVDQMEQLHIISPPEGSKPRQVLISRQQWQEMSMNAHD